MSATTAVLLGAISRLDHSLRVRSLVRRFWELPDAERKRFIEYLEETQPTSAPAIAKVKEADRALRQSRRSRRTA